MTIIIKFWIIFINAVSTQLFYIGTIQFTLINNPIFLDWIQLY